MSTDSREGPYGKYGPSTIRCPYCRTWCDCDAVDIGIGFQQCGPYYCEACGASEVGPFEPDRELDDEETKSGWYKPGSPVISHANTVDGVLVDHKTAKALYEIGLRDKKPDLG